VDLTSLVVDGVDFKEEGAILGDEVDLLHLKALTLPQQKNPPIVESK